MAAGANSRGYAVLRWSVRPGWIHADAKAPTGFASNEASLYVEALSDARTLLADFFSILL